jgi:hypothetical protein
VIETPFEIIGLEGQISIQFNDVIPVSAGQLPISIVERIDDTSARFSKAPVLAVDRPDPGITRGIFVDDVAGPVCGAVVDNQPFDRTNGLRHHAFDSFLQVRFFITRGRNDYVFDGRRIHRMIEKLKSVSESGFVIKEKFIVI